MRQRRPWYGRWWLWWTNWSKWRFEECAAGYHYRINEHDPAHPDSGGYYVTHCRYCRYEDKWESWGE